jgi:4-carboxymuconolactone decarboxylase
MLPKDIYPESGFRLPLPKRGELDDLGKEIYDEYAGANEKSLAGLRGPAGIRLYSPALARQASRYNHYLRYETGFEPHIRELAILTAARETDSQFEWTIHEPVARAAGLESRTVDAVKFEGDTVGLPMKEAIVIELGRQMLREKRVTQTLFARAIEAFGPRGLVELVALMGEYVATAALLTVFDMQLPPDREPLLPLG